MDPIERASLCLRVRCSKTETSSIYWVQLSRFHLSMQTGFSLRKVLRTMDNVKDCDSCINIPSSQTYRSYFYYLAEFWKRKVISSTLPANLCTTPTLVPLLFSTIPFQGSVRVDGVNNYLSFAIIMFIVIAIWTCTLPCHFTQAFPVKSLYTCRCCSLNAELAPLSIRIFEPRYSN
jgi:hypothetical protein